MFNFGSLEKTLFYAANNVIFFYCVLIIQSKNSNAFDSHKLMFLMKRISSAIDFVTLFVANWRKRIFRDTSWISIVIRCEVLNCRIFKNILTAMSNDWHEYSNMYAMIDKAVLAHRCSKLIISVYSIAVLLYSTASINLNKQNDGDCRELLIKMELPFGFCESPIYEIVMFVQFVRLMAVASAIGMLDALLVTLVSYDRHAYNYFSCKLIIQYFSNNT